MGCEDGDKVTATECEGCATNSMDEDALSVWKGFHGVIAAFAKFGRAEETSPYFNGLNAMIFDIHGCKNCGVDIGYGIRNDDLTTLASDHENGTPYDFNDPQVSNPERVHIPNLLNKFAGDLDAIFGPNALGTILDNTIATDIVVTPSSDSKSETGDGYFAGSMGICGFYMLDEEIDRSELKTDCLQIESHNSLRSSMANVEEYAHHLADAIQEWFQQNWNADWSGGW